MQFSPGEMPILANGSALFLLFVLISIPGSPTKTEALTISPTSSEAMTTLRYEKCFKTSIPKSDPISYGGEWFEDLISRRLENNKNATPMETHEIMSVPLMPLMPYLTSAT